MTDPISLFPDGEFPQPRSYPNKHVRPKHDYMNLENLPLELTFVNQENQLELVWKAFIANQSGNNAKLCQPMTGQMWGSGKTTFGQNLLNFSDDRIKKLFDTILRDCNPEYKNNLRNALTVYIDLQVVERRAPSQDVEEYVSWLIFSRTLQQYCNKGIVELLEFWPKGVKGMPALRSPGACTRYLQEKLGRRLYFHFDEMGNLPALLHQNSSLNRDEELNLFYLFWMEIHKIQVAEAFVFLSGRSLVLSQAGMGLGGSPCKVEQLRLSLFEDKEILKILWKDENATEIGNSLRLETKSVAADVATRLVKLTSGVPRYLTYTLCHMIEETKKCDHSIDWLNYDEDILLDVMAKVPEAIPNYHQHPELTAILLRAALQLPCKENERLHGDTGPYISDVANTYGVYMTPLDNGDFKMVLPYLWCKRAAIPLAGWNSIKAQLYDNSLAFERLIECILLERTNYNDKKVMRVSEAFEFLRDSMVAGDVVSNMTLDSMRELVTPSNLDDEFSKYYDMFPEASLLLRPQAKAHMPDLVTLLPRRSSSSSSSSSERYVIGWEMKNYSKSKLGIAAVNAEIKVFEKLVQVRGCGGGVLVIVLNGNGTASLDIEATRGRLMTKENAIPGLIVPEKVQVIILSESDLVNFAGPFLSLSN